jgi:hypothetical protein
MKALLPTKEPRLFLAYVPTFDRGVATLQEDVRALALTDRARADSIPWSPKQGGTVAQAVTAKESRGDGKGIQGEGDMACNCAVRARGVLGWLGFVETREILAHEPQPPLLGRASRIGAVLVVPERAITEHHFRVTLLSLVFTLLGGKQQPSQSSQRK